MSDRREFIGSLAAGITAAGLTSAQTGDVPRRTLGQTGVSVSCIGIGGSHIGDPKDLQTSMKIIRTAIDSGINFMDNCWDYHDGKSEDWMGQALAGGYRDKVFLMTKIDGRNKQAAAKQIDESLKRLRTDHIDLIQMHEVIRMNDPEAIFADNGAIHALTDAKKAGKLRFMGFTGHKDPKIHLHMLEIADKHKFRFDTVQMPLNVLDAHYQSFGKQVLPELTKRKIGVLGMKPLGGGIILKSKSASAMECLHWALNQPADVIINGCDSLERLQQALTAAKTYKQFTSAQASALLAKTASAASRGEFELYKTSTHFDGTVKHPEWLG